MSLSRAKLPALMTIVVLLSMGMTPLTACTQPMNNEARPEYRENPSPRQAYRLTMQIDDAPGEFAWIHGFMQYDVVNRECLPPPKDNPGGRSSPVPTRSPQFVLEQVSPGEYTGIVYADGMIDEDYHGRGVCRWALQNVQVQLKATGAEAETLFMADLHGEEVLAGRPKTIYYWKGGYPEAGIREFPDSGKTAADGFKPEIRSELFTITLAAEEMAP